MIFYTLSTKGLNVKQFADNSISLYFGLHEGRSADLEVISKAAIEWVNTVRASARTIDPSLDVRVEIIDAHEGSLSLNTVLDWGETQLAKLENIRHPRLAKLAFALSLFLVIDAGPAYDDWFGEPDTLELTEEDRSLLNELLKKISSSKEVKKHNKEFFNILNTDVAVKSVGICEESGASPIFCVPSSQFGERSGLWEQEIEIKERTIERYSDVILETPDLSAKDRRWRFFDIRTGLPFTAKMRDTDFIEALERGELKENLRTGIKMEIHIKFQERFENDEWRPDQRSIEVIKVKLT